jgi:hypothetical protein
MSFNDFLKGESRGFVSLCGQKFGKSSFLQLRQFFSMNQSEFNRQIPGTNGLR